MFHKSPTVGPEGLNTAVVRSTRALPWGLGHMIPLFGPPGPYSGAQVVMSSMRFLYEGLQRRGRCSHVLPVFVPPGPYRLRPWA